MSDRKPGILTDYERKPKQVKSSPGTEVWWYADRDGIDVYICREGVTSRCKIGWKRLATYLRKTGRVAQEPAG